MLSLAPMLQNVNVLKLQNDFKSAFPIYLKTKCKVTSNPSLLTCPEVVSLKLDPLFILRVLQKTFLAFALNLQLSTGSVAKGQRGGLIEIRKPRNMLKGIFIINISNQLMPSTSNPANYR